MSITFRSITPTELGVEYWERTAGGVLPLLRCLDCADLRHYLTSVCPDCHSTRREWTQAAGGGTVYSSTVVRYRLSAEFPTQYVLALVDLDEGVRMMANLLGTGTEAPAVVPIGTRVQLAFETLPDGTNLPQFTVTVD